MFSQKITSIKDPRISEARLLTNINHRTHQCLLEGEEIIQWALEAKMPLSHVFVSDKKMDDPLLPIMRQLKIPFYTVSEGIIKKITDTSYVISPVAVGLLKDKLHLNGGLVLLLDNIQDPGNIGTLIRTAVAFGIDQVISTKITTDFYSKKTITASRGKIFSINCQRFSSGMEAVDSLKAHGYQIIATSPHADHSLREVQLGTKPVALLVGNETLGVDPELMKVADMRVKIPMSDNAESLNVGVATGICIYEFKSRAS